MLRALFVLLTLLCSLALVFSAADSEFRRGHGVFNGRAGEFNTSLAARSKEDSFADMIDRALEKEFNETNDQSDG